MVDFVHVAVHCDSTNLGSLSVERRLQFAKDQRLLADDLRKRGIPTIWISFPRGHSSFDVLDVTTAWPARNPRQRPKSQCLAGSIDAFDVRTDEPLLVFGSQNAFEGGHLGRYIRKHFGDAVPLVTGGTTTVCVPSSLKGGLDEGFSLRAITDRLYTTMEGDGDPAAHRACLEKKLRELGVGKHPRLVLTTAEEILDVLPIIEVARQRPSESRRPQGLPQHIAAQQTGLAI